MLNTRLLLLLLFSLLFILLKVNAQCNQKDYQLIKNNILKEEKYEFVKLSKKYIQETNSKNTLIDRMLEKYKNDSLCKFVFYRSDSLKMQLVSQNKNELDFRSSNLKVKVKTKKITFNKNIEFVDSVNYIEFYTYNDFTPILPINKKRVKVLDLISIQTQDKMIILNSYKLNKLIFPILKSKDDFCRGIEIYRPSTSSEYLFIYVYGTNLEQYYFSKIVINIKTEEMKLYIATHDLLTFYNSIHHDFIGF